MPTSPLSLYILVALAKQEQYVAQIAGQIAHDSNSGFMVPERSLYKAVERLVRDGLVQVSEAGHRARVYYTLTKRGREVLVRERARLATLYTVLRERV